MRSPIAWLLTIAVITYYLIQAVILSGEVRDSWSFIDALFPLVYLSIVATVGSGILTFVRTKGVLSWPEFLKVFPYIAFIFSSLFLMFYHFGDIFGEYNATPKASHVECKQIRTGTFETKYVTFIRESEQQIQWTKLDSVKSVFSVEWLNPCTYSIKDSTGKHLFTASILSIQKSSYEARIEYEDSSWIQEIKILK